MKTNPAAIIVVIAIAAMLVALAYVNIYMRPEATTTVAAATTTIINYSAPGTINAPAEQQIALDNGFNVSAYAFACNATSDCVKVPTTFCSNNLPEQHICINQAYREAYMSEYNSTIKPQPCPLFIVDINTSCSCAANSCVENYAPR